MQTIAAGQPSFDLSPDALIALKNKGATPAVLSAMLATAHPTTAAAPTPPPSPMDAPAGAVDVPSVPTATPAPALSAPPDDPLQDPPSVEPGQVSFGYFQGQLAPYGNWVQLPEYGWCWQPTVVSQDPFWRPYCQAGHWAYTDQGWFWASDYPWGDVVFHYGRWARHPGFGWVWVPDYTWAPSWFKPPLDLPRIERCPMSSRPRQRFLCFEDLFQQRWGSSRPSVGPGRPDHALQRVPPRWDEEILEAIGLDPRGWPGPCRRAAWWEPFPAGTPTTWACPRT